MTSPGTQDKKGEKEEKNLAIILFFEFPRPLFFFFFLGV